MNFRIKCFLIHLGISVALGLAALCLVFGLWYPSPLDAALGVTSIFLILLGVDIVLGPLFTLLVSKENKTSLKFDWSVIALIQISAFVYGMYIVAIGRPVWMVFSVDRFDLVQAYQVDNMYIENAKAEFRQLAWFGPKWAAAKLPENLEERNQLTFESLFGGADLPTRPDLFVPIVESKNEIVKNARPLSELNNFNSEQDISSIMQKWPEANAFLPMMCRVKPMTVLIKHETGNVIAVVDLRPWQE